MKRALLIGILASCVGTAAFAQAGSVGGTIGNTDKSISGGTETEQARHKSQPSRQNAPARPESKQKVFVNPTIDGLPVDRCLTYAADCNEPAASAWCRRKGMTHATGWKYENKSHSGHVVGASGGDHRDCNFGCDGFTQVICE
jgi:hypothetical protein